MVRVILVSIAVGFATSGYSQGDPQVGAATLLGAAYIAETKCGFSGEYLKQSSDLNQVIAFDPKTNKFQFDLLTKAANSALSSFNYKGKLLWCDEYKARIQSLGRN